MKGERLYAIIGNPFELTKRTACNQQSNKNKAKRIAEGTKIEMQKKRAKQQALFIDDHGLAMQGARSRKQAGRNTVAPGVKKNKRVHEEYEADSDEDYNSADTRPVKRTRTAEEEVANQKKRAREDDETDIFDMPIAQGVRAIKRARIARAE